MICLLGQIQPRKRVLPRHHTNCAGPTRQHELDHADHTKSRIQFSGKNLDYQGESDDLPEVCELVSDTPSPRPVPFVASPRASRDGPTRFFRYPVPYPLVSPAYSVTPSPIPLCHPLIPLPHPLSLCFTRFFCYPVPYPLVSPVYSRYLVPYPLVHGW